MTVTRSTQDEMPCSTSIFQNGLLLRIGLMDGFPRGIEYGPNDRDRSTLPISTDDRTGM